MPTLRAKQPLYEATRSGYRKADPGGRRVPADPELDVDPAEFDRAADAYEREILEPRRWRNF